MSKCEDCKNYDQNTTSGGKGYCEYYKEYRWPDSNTCSHFEGESGSGGCYLTTACTASRNLPDNCHELETLRSFRDTYLISLENGKEEISEYYKVAPQIVEAINKRENACGIWNDLYNDMVLPCVELIENHRNEEAYIKYKEISLDLKEKYMQ